ncbi:microfibrillar-associated protein 2 isoform X2 [Equus quagga]|uniref:microfibrillar-associated protein 2 isoform X2 n=1 Tax=Equus quagga TaxID=89248 RepID=UPI001EE355EE|nr:microfibrillar-associated protein 2 isoform X2 [Equus quagga]XP_046515912.1 microfibrillar-associated protein 2 isoform X2 [Equus quagga]
MRAACLFLLFLPGLLAQGQYDLDPLPPFPDHVQYTHYSDQIDNPDYYDYQEVTPRPPEEQFQFQSQQQVQQEVIPAPTLEPGNAETEPTEPGPLEGYLGTESQSPVGKVAPSCSPRTDPTCHQTAARSSTRAPASTPYTSLASSVSTSLRRVYVVNKEICVRTVCAHEELLRADLCRDKFSKCGVMASSGLCQSVAASCARSCGGC